MTAPILEFTYTNHRGETSVRRVLPYTVWHGTTSWHPRPQFFIQARCFDQNATRDFALRDCDFSVKGVVE